MNEQDLTAQIVQDLDTLESQATEPMRQLRRAYSAELRSQPAGFVLSLAHAILATGRHRWVAYELIYAHQAAYRTLNREKLEALGQGIDSLSKHDRMLASRVKREVISKLETGFKNPR